MPSPLSYTALVIGATGSVGKEVVSALLSSDKCSSIVVVSRNSSRYSASTPKPNKVVEHVLAMPSSAAPEGPEIVQLQNAASKLFSSSLSSTPANTTPATTALFITMGAGAASKVTPSALELADVSIPVALARAACSATSVSHVSLLTAAQANASDTPRPKKTFLNSIGFVPETVALGPLYNWLKGRAELSAASLPVDSCAFFRPGTLVGSPHTPPFLRYAAPLMDKVLPISLMSSDVSVLGKAMVGFAEEEMEKGGEKGDGEKTEKKEGPRCTVQEGCSLQELYKSMRL